MSTELLDLPDDPIVEIFAFLDEPTLFSVSFSSARLRRLFLFLRPALAPSLADSAIDPSLDPYRCSIAFLEECIHHHYVSLLQWVDSSLLFPLQPFFSSPLLPAHRFLDALARTDPPTLVFLLTKGLSLSKFAHFDSTRAPLSRSLASFLLAEHQEGRCSLGARLLLSLLCTQVALPPSVSSLDVI